MNKRDMIFATRAWIIAKVQGSKKLGGERFVLTSLYFCVSEANRGSATFAEMEEVMDILLPPGIRNSHPTRYTVVTPEEALALTSASLEKFNA